MLESTRLRGLLALLCIVGLQPAPGLAAQATPDTDRLDVLFLGDDGHHQPTERARQILPVMAANGIDVGYTDRTSDLNPGTLADYHALILYNNHPAVSDDELDALLGFVEAGGGLVVVHCASASFQNSETFIKLVGAAFKSHGTGTFSAVRTAPDHPAIQDVPVFESWDETYVHTKHNPVDRTVLEVRREAGHDEPWTWVRTYGEGRVFYTAWGHDERTWGNEGFQELLGRGVRWATGDWALDMTVDDPEIETEALDVPLPTYERPPADWNTLAEPVTEAQVALPTEASLRLTTLPPGFAAAPFAIEPMIGNVIDFTWDERGRMWAVETNDYPNVVLPDSVPGNDRILILEDTDGDGMADETTVFAEGLNLASSLAFAGGGLVVAQAPYMLFFRDTDGDDRADERSILSSGWPRSDTHGTPSNLRYGLDNQVLGSVGYNGFRGTVGGRTWERGEFGAGYYRFPADGSSLEYLARTSNNTWGVDQNEEGEIFGSTANRRPSVHVPIPARYYHALGRREPVQPGIEDSPDIFPVRDILQVDQFDMYTAGSAHEVYTARAFPEEYWNRAAFVAEPTGHLIGMFDLQPRGGTFAAENRWSFLASRDQWGAPVQVKVGPDGALWVSDFYTLVAQHNPTPRDMMGCCERGPGNAYETPNRDRLHGRIYRIAYEGSVQSAGEAGGNGADATRTLDGATAQDLVATLRDGNMFWRLTAQRLLVERGQTDVVPALVDLVEDHTMDRLGLNPGALHGIWTLDGLGALTAGGAALDAVRRALHHPAPSVRRAALKVLPRDGRLLDDVLAAGMLPDRSSPTEVDYTVGNPVLQDADPRVRLEALLVLSELEPDPRAAAAAAEALFTPANARDRWLAEAAAMAGAAQGPDLVPTLMERDPPQDSVAVAGVARALGMMARSHASAGEVETVLPMITAVGEADPAVGSEVVEGIAEGWPEESPADLTAEQRQMLEAARAEASGLAEAFQELAERWGLAGG